MVKRDEYLYLHCTREMQSEEHRESTKKSSSILIRVVKGGQNHESGIESAKFYASR